MAAGVMQAWAEKPDDEVRLEPKPWLLSFRARRVADRAPTAAAALLGSGTVGDLKAELCRKLGRAEAEVCLWQEQEGGRLRLLEGCQELTLQACNLEDGTLLVVDERSANGAWSLGSPSQPRPAPTPQEPEPAPPEVPAAAGAAPDAVPTAAPATAPATAPAAAPAARHAAVAAHATTVGGSRLGVRTSGIANLGNTCFMGSSLQCLANVPALRDYFLSADYVEALRKPGSTPEPTSRRLADGFATLLRKLWRRDAATVSPWSFKDLIERTSDRFSGYRQHDSMEFVEFLIDGLKEDCNRVKGQKPYIERADADGRPDSQVALEAANDFLQRSDSLVDDLFVGFEKITTTCPVCDRESVVFDPFLSVKVPLTSPRADHEVKFAVTAVPAESSRRRPLRLHVTARRSDPAGTVLSEAARRAGLLEERCLLVEARGTRFQKVLEDDDSLGDILPHDVLILAELDEEVQDLRDKAARRSLLLEDMLPLELVDRLEEAALRAERHRFETRLETCFEWLTEREQLSEHDAAYCSRCKEHRQAFRKVEFWSLPPVLVLQLKRFEYSSVMRRRLSTPVHFPMEGLDLSRFCLSEEASFPEGRCLRAGQRVTIAGLQSAAGARLNGLEGVVMYLDTGSYRFCVRLQEGDPVADWKRLKPANLVPVPSSPHSRAAPRSLYDLVGVSKHMGATSFGHYVSYTRSCEDGVWRVYDDDEVREVEAKDVETEIEGAYVLFYLRRDCRPTGWASPKADNS